MPGNSELAKIVGPENVKEDPDTLRRYSEDESFVNPLRPRCVLKPKNTEEVQDIINWANETGTPLVPVSSGPPRFRGDTVPSVGAAVVVDLSDMKRIIRVDRKNRGVMMEPGVTFSELIPELEKADLAPYSPLLPRSTKSVVASLLEREPITMPMHHWETQDPMCCTEVIYGSGARMRTGDASGPGTIEEQWAAGRAQLGGNGPAMFDLSKLLQGAQGTIGIVTWATMVCKILPKATRSFLVPSDDIEHLVDLTYRLLWKKLDAHYVILNSQNLASILGEDTQEIKALSAILPPWILFLKLEGGGIMPEEKVAYQEVEIREMAQVFGLYPQNAVPGASAEEVAKALSGTSGEPYWKLKLKGGCHDIFFYTTMDQVPGFIAKLGALSSESRYPATDIGMYVQPVLQGANCHCEFNLSYDPESSEELEKVKVLTTEGSRALANMGAFFSRPYGPWADIAYGRSVGSVVALRKVKEVFDPKSIMNPGKLCF